MPITVDPLIKEYGGIDRICEEIASGQSTGEIATRIGVPVGSMSAWYAKPENHTRVQEARRLSASHWDELAEQTIKNCAPDKIGVAKARELANHYRWRASKLNPAFYGDKVTADVNATFTIRDLVRASLTPAIEQFTISGQAQEIPD